MKAYWDSLTKEQQGELAGKVGSTPGYLRLVFNGYKKASFVLAKKLEQCTSGAITKSDLRPDMDNADINQRLLEVIEQIGSYSKQIRSAIEDGVVEPHEKTAINDELYLSISKLQEHAALVYKIFCISESNDARECAAPGVVASIASGCGETNA